MTNSDLVEAVRARNIEEVVHFTSNNGLVGALQVGALISRRQLPEEKHLAYVAAPTAAARAEATEFFDKARDWLDYINMSITEINSSYFRFAARWHANTERWWTLLSFDAEILSHDGVFFATTNNIYEHVQRMPGRVGFENLFADRIRRKGPTWCAIREARPSYLPTCEQAEVLYPSRLSLDYLRRVYVRSGEEHDYVDGWLRLFKRDGVDVIVDAERFLGAPN